MKTLRTWAAALTLTLASTTTSFARVNLTNLTGGLGGGGTFVQPPINYPSSFKIAYRALQASPSLLSNVGISWTDNSIQDVSTIIERSPDGTTWATRKSYPTALDGPQSWTDTDLPPDTKFCYRLTTRGPNGQSITTSPLCALTQVRNDIGVWRTELRVRVANVPNAGTDRWIAAALTFPVNNLPGGNYTGINYAIDDFEAGSDMTYDLSQTGITALHDISRIYLGISHWDDAVCLRDIELKVNGQVAFQKAWGNTASTCQWIGGSNGPQWILIDHAEMRANPTFANFTAPSAGLIVLKDELASRIESLVGSMLFQRTDVAWRGVDSGYGVQVSKKLGFDNVVHVKLPLEGLVDNFPNPDIDIQFDVELKFVPNGAKWDLHLDVVNLTGSADFAWWAEVLGALLDPICAPVIAISEGRDPFLDCMTHLEDYIADSIRTGFSPQSQRITVAVPETCGKPTVGVDSNANVRFGCDAPRRRPRGQVGGVLSAGGVVAARR